MLYPELLREIWSRGDVVCPRGLEIRELMHQKLDIEDVNFYSFGETRNFNKLFQYFKNEMAWYLSCDRDASFIVDKAKLWDKIKNPDNSLNSAYGFLVFKQKTPHPSLGAITMTGFDWALQCLRKDKDSRQAVCTYNNAAYNYEGNSDYICSQAQLFYIRNNALDCYVPLRSSDAIFGLQTNQPWWSFVQQQLRLMLLSNYPDLRLGNITVDIYSAHLYSMHYKLAEQILITPAEKWFVKLKKIVPIGERINFYLENFEEYFEIIRRA